MRKLHYHAAGIDIGAEKIFIAIEGLKVCSFSTFTSDFRLAVEYLLSHQIKTVAMEATGVYWVILYDMLEVAGLDVWLVDGRATRQAPGRKTDVKDCQWIQELHSCGLLKRCFIPDAHIQELRSYQRLREDHIRSSSMHINHMQKALTLMNIRLKEVLNQIHGVSGLAMIRAILAGERDAKKLLALCHHSIKKKKADQVLKALEGHYKESGLFELKQAYQSYEFYQARIRECDQQLEMVLKKMNGFQPEEEKKEMGKRKPIRHNRPQIADLGWHLLEIFGGKDATQLSGITDYTWLQLYTETGSDLTKWVVEKRFTSWLGLAPGQNHSGKKRRNKRKKGHPKAGQIFRQIARSLIESKNIALGAFGRRIKGRRGPGVAIKAVARKLAVLYWRMMVKGLDYVERGVKAYEEKMKLQNQRWLEKKAQEMGYQLTPVPS
mgnify:CR=1 FL=1